MRINVSYRPFAQWRHFDQNPSGFRFLVQIRALVTQTSLGVPNFKKYERKKRMNSGLR